MSTVVHAFVEGEAAGRALAEALGAPFGLVQTHAFPDGELLSTVPGSADTVIVYRSLENPNAKLIELVLATEAWRRLGAKRLVLVAPYLAYMRQDAAFAPGQAVSQRAIAGLISGVFDRVVTVNAHLHRTFTLEAVFPNIAADNLSAGAAIGAWLEATGASPDTLVVGPDQESTPLARAAAVALGAHWIVLAKTRSGDRDVDLRLDAPNGVAGKPVVLIDDVCSTGATLTAAITLLKGQGARDVRAVVVHALFDELTLKRLKAAGASTVASTSSTPHPTNAISLTPLLADALRDEVAR